MIARNALCAFCGAIVRESELTFAGECRYVEDCASSALLNNRLPEPDCRALEAAATELFLKRFKLGKRRVP